MGDLVRTEGFEPSKTNLSSWCVCLFRHDRKTSNRLLLMDKELKFGTRPRIRTGNLRILSPTPLPIELRGHNLVLTAGLEPATLALWGPRATSCATSANGCACYSSRRLAYLRCRKANLLDTRKYLPLCAAPTDFMRQHL